MRKSLFLFVLVCLCAATGNAQLFKKIVPAGNNISNAVAQVALHFQSNYYAIQGEELPPDAGRMLYRSTLNLPGAAYSVIYRFGESADSSAAFESLLYEGENYKEALKAYKLAFRQVKGTKFTACADKISFDGTLQEPEESVRFTSSILYATASCKPYEHFMAEVEMQQSIEGYKVKLFLHSRKKDQDRYE